MKGKIGFTLAFVLTLALFAPVLSEEGELLIEDGGSVNVIGRSLVLTGNITVKDDSQLLLAGSRVQLSVRGEKAYNVSTLDLGKMTVRTSTLETLSGASTITLSNHSTMELINSNITGFKSLQSYGNSTLIVQGSRLLVGYIESRGEAVSIIDGYMPKGAFNINATEAEIEGFRGDIVYVDVISSKLKELDCSLLNAKSVQPLYLNKSKVTRAELQSNAEVIVYDSVFNSLVFHSSGVAVNVRTGGGGSRAGGAIYAVENATVQRYWYLTVKVTDPSEVGIPAKIVLADHLGNPIATGQADIEGAYMKPTLAEIINGSRTVFTGNYRIWAEYLNYTTLPVELVLDGNREVELMFQEYVPLETTTELTVSPTIVKVGDPLKIKGSINSREPGEFVEIVVINPEELRAEFAYRTGEEGVFEGEYKPEIEGEWVIYADWIGGPSHEMATRSRAYVITVEPRPTIIELLIMALPIVILVIGVLASLAFLALRRMKGPKITGAPIKV